MPNPSRTIPQLTEQQLKRFDAKIDRSPGFGPNGNCWVWTGTRSPSGYGGFGSPKYGKYGAHRIAYMLAFGDDPGPLFVLHRCDNPPCVRPEHLFVGTPLDNMRDAVSKNRQARGERVGLSKLTAAHVATIREQYVPHVVSASHLATKFSVSKKTILLIVHDRTWKHLRLSAVDAL